MTTTLFLGVTFSVVTALVYALVGRRVGARRLRGDDALANRMFARWWFSLGALTAAAAIINLAAGVGYTETTLHAAFTVIVLGVLCYALAALAFYFAYLFTGYKRAMVPIGAFYALFFVAILVLMWRAHPIGVETGAWAATLEYERPLVTDAGGLLLLTLLVAPQIVGGLAYLSLLFRVEERSQRYRIAMIAGSIVIWFGSSIVANVAGWTGAAWWPVATRVIALVAAIVVYAAFQPPGWAQRRFGLQPVSVLVRAPLGSGLRPGTAPRARRAEAMPPPPTGTPLAPKPI